MTINPKYDGSRYHIKTLKIWLVSFFYEKIHIQKKDTIVDSRNIIHEYLHKLSFRTNIEEKESHNLYKEMTSKYELELLRDVRKKSYYRNVMGYLVCEPLINTLIKAGKLTEKSIREYTSFKFLNDTVLKHVIKNFQQIPSLAYRYLLGTPLAATLCGISNEGFKTIIENLNKVEIEEYNKMVSSLFE